MRHSPVRLKRLVRRFQQLKLVKTAQQLQLQKSLASLVQAEADLLESYTRLCEMALGSAANFQRRASALRSRQRATSVEINRTTRELLKIERVLKRLEEHRQDLELLEAREVLEMQIEDEAIRLSA